MAVVLDVSNLDVSNLNAKTSKDVVESGVETALCLPIQQKQDLRMPELPQTAQMEMGPIFPGT